MIVILTTLYNAEEYIGKCIKSIKSQNNKDYRCFILNDLSTDISSEIAEELIRGDERFTLINNTRKMYQPGNYDQIIRGDYNIQDEDLIVELDGDDWFPDNEVLDRIFEAYSDGNTWITNGSFIYSDGRQGFSSKQNNFDNLREAGFTASHLRTWKAFLWRNIKQSDLMDENGEYWSVAGDLSFMFPMLEMSGEEHYKFLSDINYVYNEQNPINDHKINVGKVRLVETILKKYPIYNKLDK
jgi:glycosyltransferase involved in cell wall biosynthesis